MKQYSSKVLGLQAGVGDVYLFLSDFRNFQRVLPAEIGNWQAEADSCSFDVPMLGKVSFTYAEKQLNTILRIAPGAEMPVVLTILCKFEEAYNQAQVVIEAELPMVQEMFLGRVMQNIADLMGQKLEALTPEDVKVI